MLIRKLKKFAVICMRKINNKKLEEIVTYISKGRRNFSKIYDIEIDDDTCYNLLLQTINSPENIANYLAKTNNFKLTSDKYTDKITYLAKLAASSGASHDKTTVFLSVCLPILIRKMQQLDADSTSPADDMSPFIYTMQ